MARAIQLAKHGKGSVSPNPLVGCIIVENDMIIGEGWHERYGEAHAEVNAFKDLVQHDFSDSTAYVNLEPCSHYGKTPPCADFLVKQGIRKVVIANSDLNPLVAGRGISILKEAGVKVITGVLEMEGRKLNKRFFTMFEKSRPFIILKWAQTSDGFIARVNNDSKWISADASRKLVHKWRSEEDAILIGGKTLIHDNPQLNVRNWHGRNPTRMAWISSSSLHHRNYHFWDGSQRTIIFNDDQSNIDGDLEFVMIDKKKGVEQMMMYLHKEQIQSVIVEGGTRTINKFIEADCWDEAKVFISEAIFKEGIKAPHLDMEPISEEQIQQDILFSYVNIN